MSDGQYGMSEPQGPSGDMIGTAGCHLHSRNGRVCPVATLETTLETSFTEARW